MKKELKSLLRKIKNIRKDFKEIIQQLKKDIKDEKILQKYEEKPKIDEIDEDLFWLEFSILVLFDEYKKEKILK